ncbi:MAG: fibronectin type III domain-containing protein, partial [Sedimentisphaerales bacterium]
MAMGTWISTYPQGGSASVRYATEGTYAASVVFTGAEGQRTLSNLWVDAIGPRERVGVHVLVQYPVEGQTVERDGPCLARAISYTGAPVKRLELAVDGVPTSVAFVSPYELDVPWQKLGAGEHELSFRAVDATGNAGDLKRNIRVAEYFNLLPADGAVFTGDDLTVSWVGSGFGSAMVQYRRRGQEAWTTVEGPNARLRRVRLEGLEAGQTYEWRPVGGGEVGPQRTATLVKGLAFGRSIYGGTIARDYDQRVSISVRNHAEKSQTVRLECGRPESELMLVGFVGDGSEGAPFELGPGEEREFLLGISAQDVISEHHHFPVRITSSQGYSDEAMVDLFVRLPKVEFEWTDLGPTDNGLGRRQRLVNRGDTLTDFWLRGSSDDVLVSPAVEHGSFAAGTVKDVTVRPRL